MRPAHSRARWRSCDRSGRGGAPSRGTSGPRRRRRSGSGSRSARRSAADHAHDLYLVAIAQRQLLIRGAVYDLAVVLDCHRARVDAELLEISEQWGWRPKLHLLAVDLERDHWNILIAA